jgi:hypothetical protein
MPLSFRYQIPTYEFQNVFLCCTGWGAKPGSFVFSFIFSSPFRWAAAAHLVFLNIEMSDCFINALIHFTLTFFLFSINYLPIVLFSLIECFLHSLENRFSDNFSTKIKQDFFGLAAAATFPLFWHQKVFHNKGKYKTLVDCKIVLARLYMYAYNYFL